MLHIDDFTCCPHCGGTDGYYYTRDEKFCVSGTFEVIDGVKEAAEHIYLLGETRPKCDECNKIIF